jgi:uncharacterized protein YgiM (DUF1202 family)
MRTLFTVTVAVFLCLVTPAYGKNRHYEAVVAEPFLELHTGPGRGFPVFHVVDRGERIEVLKQRTDWFKVRDAGGTRGWVRADQLAETLDAAGQPVKIVVPGAETWATHRFEAGVQLGDLDGANIITLTGGYRLTRNLTVELQASDTSGDFSDGWLLTASLVHQPFPAWRLSPYAMLGTGISHVEPKTTLVQTDDRTDQVGQVGVGVQAYITRRFMFRAGYASYLVFTSRDDNEELDEWKAGFAVFF